MTRGGAVFRGGIRTRVAILFLVLATLCVARQDLVGTWKGEAMPVVAFLPHAPLPVEISINGDAVTGRVGDAKITGGEVKQVPGGISRWFTHADYVVTARLDGELVEGTGVRRKEFHVYVTWKGADLQAFAASDGSMCFPWSNEDVLRKAMTVQTLGFALKRIQ
jgi:hypothetical protein